jgi:Putative Ig domain
LDANLASNLQKERKMSTTFRPTGNSFPPPGHQTHRGLKGPRWIQELLADALSNAAILFLLLASAGSAGAFEAFDNGRLRFGTGSQASVNAAGNLQQPFYYDSVLNGGGWFKLTYRDYPLNWAIGVGGDGTANWNVNGAIVQDLALPGQVLDVSGFVRTNGDRGYGVIVSTGTINVDGRVLQIRNRYALGQNDAFIRISTQLTNTGATPVQNLRVWVGTQDDWVGTTDTPTKRRGNLVNGAFADIPTAATQSRALQISSGSTGVLFFSTSSRAHTSIRGCCSFENAYRQDPATSAITATNDGSYAMFVRMNDLAVGQSDEFTWFYAAGELGNLADIIASVAAASSVTLAVNVPITPFIPVVSSGGTPPLTYSISPALPAGLVFNSTNGQISGTPAAASPSTVYTVTITDSAANSTSASFSLTVEASTETKLDVRSSANIAAWGMPVTLTASVNVANPTGEMEFVVYHADADSGYASVICASVRPVGGTATCLVPGRYHKSSQVTYQVGYRGDPVNPPAYVILPQLIDTVRATLTATAAPTVPVAGRPLTLNAMVVQRGMAGKIDFYEHGALIAGCAAVPLTPMGGSTDIGTASCRIANPTAGQHTFVVTLPYHMHAGFEQVAVQVEVAAAGPLDYSDMWWGGSAENGWGVSISQHGATQFVVLYVYDNAGNPVWYAMPGGQWSGNAVYTGALYRPTSAPFSAYDVSRFNANASVGTATLAFSSANTGTLTYTIDGVSGSKPIQRMQFWVDTGQPRFDVEDLWWGGETENGWGLHIAQQGPMLFPVWFTYDKNGNTTWFAVPGGAWQGNSFVGDVYRTTSSGWLGQAYDATRFRATRVGNMTIEFSAQDSAILSFRVEEFEERCLMVRQRF